MLDVCGVIIIPVVHRVNSLIIFNFLTVESFPVMFGYVFEVYIYCVHIAVVVYGVQSFIFRCFP